MAEEEENESTENEGGSKKKLIIIIAAVVLLLGGGGAGLYFSGFFDEEVVAESSDEDAPADEEDVAEAEPAGPIEYYSITPPFLVNFSQGDIKIMKVSISTVTRSAEVIDALKLHDPVIRNNILGILSAQNAENLKSTEGKQTLQTTLTDEVNKILAERDVKQKVDDVYFTDLVMQ